MALTKSEMAERLNETIGLNKREAKDIVELFFTEIRDSLVENEQVKLSGFGNFDLRDKRQRPGRNPKTGEKYPFLLVVVTFRPGQKLKVKLRLMLATNQSNDLPDIPGKRQFSIGEVADLCAVKPMYCVIGNRNSHS